MMNIITIACVLILRVSYSSAFLLTSINLQGCPNRLESFYPKCGATEKNIGYDTEERKYVPMICPSISSGKYPPDCHCRYGGAYVASSNSCPDPKCPTKSVTHGSYPNCECTEPNEEYNAYLNECVMKCPVNSTGRFPDCKCDDESEGFSKEWFKYDKCPPESRPGSVFPNCVCETGNYLISLWEQYINVCVSCSDGIPGDYPHCEECTNGRSKYPNCTCNDKDHLFSAYWNFCYPDCLEPARYGLIPDLTKCVDRYAFPGRQCPPDSIGVSPDCKCIGDRKIFHPYGWGCYDLDALAWGSNKCANKLEKWPQCTVSIDSKVLMTLIG